MQVHAVPDSERAFDSSGRRLPWAIEYADSDHGARRMPEERGPFGKARKRGLSRSRTPTARIVEDTTKSKNQQAVDDIILRTLASSDTQQQPPSLGRKSSGPISQLPASAAAPNLTDGALTNTASREPKEVILYGFGSEAQWAAISYFEKVSNGVIYEEYERNPSGSKYATPFSAKHRDALYRSLSKSAVNRVNSWVGGEHWIKVTFDSTEAAERACHYSPYAYQGYTIFAEFYRGTGPTGGDRAIRAQPGGSSLTASPNTVSSATLQMGASQSSATASSATVTASIPASNPPHSTPLSRFRASGAFPTEIEDETPSVTVQARPASQNVAQTSSQPHRPGKTTLRIKNAKPVVFLPQEKAFLPAPPPWQQTLSSFPIIGWVIGSGHGIIGDQVPRKEDGSFDNASASLYWRVWYTIDSCFGTDFCGVKEAEYDE
ncbi:hypothetical protein DM02DRAFT_573496 [Periconia macrospinosa]|uniref:Uncharacterized protein n=1 Tax=Periconia macrospinosa TaxID=97972 RepID=A0A2V1DA76_9PLEO|nr:hypothetical protein DM02DRAFT_573496 [Periconia macrospinosa]